MTTGISRARELRRRPTEAERMLWQRLRNAQICGCRFRRQAPVGNYIVDFACFSPRLVIEIDGGQHALTPIQAHDAARTAWLESHGFLVRRFWNNEVLGNIEGVVSEIAAILDRLAPD